MARAPARDSFAGPGEIQLPGPHAAIQPERREWNQRRDEHQPRPAQRPAGGDQDAEQCEAKLIQRICVENDANFLFNMAIIISLIQFQINSAL